MLCCAVLCYYLRCYLRYHLGDYLCYYLRCCDGCAVSFERAVLAGLKPAKQCAVLLCPAQLRCTTTHIVPRCAMLQLELHCIVLSSAVLPNAALRCDTNCAALHSNALRYKQPCAALSCGVS